MEEKEGKGKKEEKGYGGDEWMSRPWTEKDGQDGSCEETATFREFWGGGDVEE